MDRPNQPKLPAAAPVPAVPARTSVDTKSKIIQIIQNASTQNSTNGTTTNAGQKSQSAKPTNQQAFIDLSNSTSESEDEDGQQQLPAKMVAPPAAKVNSNPPPPNPLGGASKIPGSSASKPLKPTIHSNGVPVQNSSVKTPMALYSRKRSASTSLEEPQPTKVSRISSSSETTTTQTAIPKRSVPANPSSLDTSAKSVTPKPTVPVPVITAPSIGTPAPRIPATTPPSTTVRVPAAKSTITPVSTLPGTVAHSTTVSVAANPVSANPATATPVTANPSVTTVPGIRAQSTKVPPTTVPVTATTVTKVPATTVPVTTVPAAKTQSTTVTSTTVPVSATTKATTIPATRAPSTTVPATTVPRTSKDSFLAATGAAATSSIKVPATVVPPVTRVPVTAITAATTVSAIKAPSTTAPVTKVPGAMAPTATPLPATAAPRAPVTTVPAPAPTPVQNRTKTTPPRTGLVPMVPVPAEGPGYGSAQSTFKPGHPMPYQPNRPIHPYYTGQQYPSGYPMQQVPLVQPHLMQPPHPTRPVQPAQHRTPTQQRHESRIHTPISQQGTPKHHRVNTSGAKAVPPTFDAMKECDKSFADLVKLQPIPATDPLPRLLPKEIAELELALQIGDKFEPVDTWREDWNGNLQLIDKDIVMNQTILIETPDAPVITLPFIEWVAKHAQHSGDFRGITLLFSYVYHMAGTPQSAKKIMAYYLSRPAEHIADRMRFILEAIRRISYDPYVLIEDGWTITKSDKPDGKVGGAYLIGRRVIWHRYEAIIFAYVKDDEIGDLWKAIWIEDCDTFDLETDELQEAIKRWDKQAAKRERKATTLSASVETTTRRVGRPSASIRFEASRNFTVEGVEEGIILATSYNARNAVPWPARILHVTEVKERNKLSRRSSSKNEIHVVFLAPYWNGRHGLYSKGRSSQQQQANGTTTNIFSSGPLFEIESIDVSEDTIKSYPYDGKDGSLSIDKLRSEFSFLDLSKNAFPRYLESHRMAIALKIYARKELTKKISSSADNQASAFASLTETHPLSVKTPQFPDEVLSLPYEYIISKFPPVDKATKLGNDAPEEVVEPIMQLSVMLKSLVPPICWGKSISDNDSVSRRNTFTTPPSAAKTIESPAAKTPSSKTGDSETMKLEYFASDYLLNHIKATDSGVNPLFLSLGNELQEVMKELQACISVSNTVNIGSVSFNSSPMKAALNRCLSIKGHGEDIMQLNGKIPKDIHLKSLILEWRRACERIYKRAIIDVKGDGRTAVITDSRCNQHITAAGSFERAVRLPAAIRAAKLAGSGQSDRMPLLTKVEEYYVELTESKILPMAHSTSYLKRMRDKIHSIPPNVTGVPLTDGSDGEGGDDTMGSRGSYLAAVLGVAAALQGVDMVMSGKCINGFCAVRPPGHHAGKDLRAMNAVSNGFCLLNAAACAALYAVTPILEGGLGLKRICIIDFDVHHGNGTQDILCSTHDSRFLYVSTHVGGAHINGYEDDTDGMGRSLNSQEGIFPGRCGDTSPHNGVLNIPLGRKVTPQDLGSALVGKVAPRVEEFCPDLIILSAGFDAHKHDPLGMGGLSADNFGALTTVICDVAHRVCSGRVISILEGGYGVPCCRPLRNDLFLPKPLGAENKSDRPPPKVFDLGDDLPSDMTDIVDFALQQKLEKCHQEGFLECVREHVSSLSKNNSIINKK